MHCTNCGKELADQAKFCDGCGSPIVASRQSTQAAVQNSYVKADAQENKVVFILAYLGILFFLPLVSCPKSKAGRFHANQGLVLLIAAILGQIAVSILSGIILAISWRLWAISSLISTIWSIAILALAIIGMVNANKGEQKPLPFIGMIKILK